MINYVVLRPGFNFWMQEHLGYFLAQGRKKRAITSLATRAARGTTAHKLAMGRDVVVYEASTF